MKRALVPVFVVAALLGCGDKKERQSLKEAMEILCVTDVAAGVDKLAPAERVKAKFDWIDARLKNQEARDAFTRIADLAPSEQAQMFFELATKAKLDRCAAVEEAAAGGVPPGMALPELGAVARGAVPLDDAAPLVSIVASSTDLVVERRSVLSLTGGLPDMSEVSGGADGMNIDRLRALAEAHAAEGKAAGRPLAGARLLFHPDTPAKLLFMVIMTTKAVGWKQFELVARREGALVAIPITLRDKVPATPGAADAPLTPEPDLTVAVSKGRLIVFSFSGTEGTLSKPKLSTSAATPADLARVQETLVEIQTRRTDDRRILAMFDPTTPMQLVVETLAAIRARPDGGPLFTDVTLGGGFE